MLFNSTEFLFFFIIVTPLYFLLKPKYRWMLLLTASCVFYMYFIPFYILILVFTILVDYSAGLLIAKSEKHKRNWLLASIFANIGVLAFFKYYNFLAINISSLSNLLHWNYSLETLKMILPIGLSFHVFQSLSYTIEVYRGNQRAERHLGIFALYVMFYPQLVAGPIERPQNLFPQFRKEHKFDIERVISGLKLMGWGFFKKVVIADRLSVVTNTVFNDVHSYSGLPLLLAVLFFSIQIYCDFSGYSDIALGSAEVMGFKLMKNFNSPYFAQSIAEFWSRWHISLSTWFKDYLYIPLGGSKVKNSRRNLNLVITFAVSGLWHGANWTFIFWGLLHGIYRVMSLVTDKSRKKIVSMLKLNAFPAAFSVVKVLVTFSFVTFAWIFFRANNFQDAFYVIGNLFDNKMEFESYGALRSSLASMGLSNSFELYLIMLSAVFLFVVEFLYQKKSTITEFFDQNIIMRWGFYYIIVIMILFFGAFNNSQQFIYFQF